MNFAADLGFGNLTLCDHNDNVVVVLPDFDDTGALPPGIHEGTWDEVVELFGRTAHRQDLLAGLHDALRDLQAAGCRRAYLDGSFVTDKESPGDFDLCWDEDHVDWTKLDPVLLETRPPRVAQQARYRGDIFRKHSRPAGLAEVR